MTRAIVTGATGLLGRAVVKEFKDAGIEVTGTGLRRAHPPEVVKLDLNDDAEITALLDKIKPDVVIHAAANRFPDACSQDPEGARAVNVVASRVLARACNKRGVLLFYISTDYVFPGRPGEAPYEADAPAEPTNVYGQTKLEGEQAVLAETRDSGLGVVFRVPVFYGETEEGNYGESAINTLYEAVHKAQTIHNEGNQQPMKMDDWSVRYPTNTADVASVLRDTAKKYRERKDDLAEMPKVLQFSAKQAYTKYGICELLARDVLGIKLDGMTPDKSAAETPPGAVQRPYNTQLSTRELEKLSIDVRAMDFTDWWRREVRAFRH